MFSVSRVLQYACVKVSIVYCVDLFVLKLFVKMKHYLIPASLLCRRVQCIYFQRGVSVIPRIRFIDNRRIQTQMGTVRRLRQTALSFS